MGLFYEENAMVLRRNRNGNARKPQQLYEENAILVRGNRNGCGSRYEGTAMLRTVLRKKRNQHDPQCEGTAMKPEERARKSQ